MAFTPDGKQLLVATSIGSIIIIDPETSNQFKQPNINDLSVIDTSSDTTKVVKIEQIIVSDDGKFFACSDNQCCISLFKHSKVYDDEEQKVEEWWFIGKIKTHVRGITSISSATRMTKTIRSNIVFSRLEKTDVCLSTTHILVMSTANSE